MLKYIITLLVLVSLNLSAETLPPNDFTVNQVTIRDSGGNAKTITVTASIEFVDLTIVERYPNGDILAGWEIHLQGPEVYTHIKRNGKWIRVNYWDYFDNQLVIIENYKGNTFNRGNFKYVGTDKILLNKKLTTIRVYR